MKKTIAFLVVFMIPVVLVMAGNPMDYDVESVESEFSTLNKIEAYVQNHEGAILEELKVSHPGWVAGIASEADFSGSFTMADALPLDIPAFWWGCVLSLAGVVVVYVLTKEDKEQTKMALYGCLASGVLWGLWVFVFGRLWWWY